MVHWWRRRPRGEQARPGRSRAATRVRIVALVGIDGSGKTTQAHRLATELNERGIPADYWQNAGGRRWLGRLARRVGQPDAQHLVGRRGLLVIESSLRWLAIVRALTRSFVTGRVAVMDRYAICQYASIRAHGGRPDGLGERLARLAYRVFPAPDVAFMLTVDPVEAYRRIDARGTDHESQAFLAASAAVYRELPEYRDLVIIPAGGPPDDVTARLWEALDRLARSSPARP